MKAFYINLDYRTDRKEQIERELNAKDIPFERYSAIYHKIGSIGCSKSHLNAIKLARDRNYNNIIIFEDDFKFIVNKDEFYQEIEKLNSITFDVCLLSYNTTNLYKYNNFLYKIKDAQTTSGYIVNSNYYNTLINYWEESVNAFEKIGKIGEGKYTCDQSWKKLQEKHNWYCFKKRIGKQRESYSDIEKRIVNYNV